MHSDSSRSLDLDWFGRIVNVLHLCSGDTKLDLLWSYRLLAIQQLERGKFHRSTNGDVTAPYCSQQLLYPFTIRLIL
jgi:hypothetical protein